VDLPVAGNPEIIMTVVDLRQIRTLPELLTHRADVQPDALALRFYRQDEQVTQQFTYGELDTSARSIAAMLRERFSPGDRALLMFPPGIDFAVNFCACLYAGIVAVPAYPPEMHRLEHAVRRLQSIIDDAQPVVVMTTPEILDMAGPLAQMVVSAKKLFEIPWMSSAKCKPEDAKIWSMPDIHSNNLAFLQYTSGSTGNPKGSMLSHGNLLSDLEMIQTCFGNHEQRQKLDTLSWVPLYHDLGLIGLVLTAFYTGGTCNVMSPIDFLKKPVRWLRLLSKTKAHVSGGPNFGFDLCLRKVTPEEVSGLDLSHVLNLANCAEPIRTQTIDNFYERFAPAGLKRNAFCPCYGLAEATVMATCTRPSQRPTFVYVDAEALTQHLAAFVDASSPEAIGLVGCGKPANDGEVEIVSPTTLTRVRSGVVGEIWVRGSNVAAGYWNRPEETQATFGARLEGEEKTYLRTGDLGFIHEGELYVTGRLKDLVIVRGRNLYPHDIERTVDDLRSIIPEIRIGCSAAFSRMVDDREELVFIQEVNPPEAGKTFDANACVREIRRVIFENFEVQPHAVVLLKSGAIPKTSSGKIMRSACRATFSGPGFGDGVVPLPEVVNVVELPDSEEEFSEPAALSTRTFASSPISIGSSPASSATGPVSSWRPTIPVATGTHTAASPHSRQHADQMLEWLREWAPMRFDPQLADTRRTIAPHVILDLGNAGVLGMRVPERWGGKGISSVDMTRVIQQMAAIDVTLASIVGVNNALGIHPILGFARPEMRDELLPDLAAGRKLAAFALTERAAGSNPLAMEAKAVRNSSHSWNLFGEKIWTGLGSWAGVINVFVRHEGGSEGVSAFSLMQPKKGMRIGPEAMTLGVRSMVQSSIRLEGVEASERELLGTVGHGFDVAVSTMTEGRLAIAAASVGGLKRCLQLMVRYAERRSISTGILFDNPVASEQIARATYATLSLDSLVGRLAALRDSKTDLPSEVFGAAKVIGSELFWTTADDLVQLLGGRGYMEPNDAARLLRDARLLRIFEGPSETLAAHLGSSFLRAPGYWRTLLTSSLRAPRIASKLARSADELIKMLGDRPDVSSRRLVQYRAGIVLCWGILSAALESGGGRGGLWARATIWLADRFDEAVREAQGAWSRAQDLPSRNELCDMVHRFAAQVGDLELPGHGEDLETDPLLRNVVEQERVERRSEPPSAVNTPAKKVTNPIVTSTGAMRGTTLPRASAISQNPEKTLHSRMIDISEPSHSDKPVSPQATQQPSEGSREQWQEVETWLIDWVAMTLTMDASRINVEEPLTSYGVDSLIVLQATCDIEERFGLDVPESVFWNHRSIRALSKYVGARLVTKERA
jgi:acyl-CoA synthetase (AMP-forming)/AMP-acid ligase II/alkylation response protein AidB-like acyl-CoA dehydrogenase/acyl carrier protein